MTGIMRYFNPRYLYVIVIVCRSEYDVHGNKGGKLYIYLLYDLANCWFAAEMKWIILPFAMRYHLLVICNFNPYM